MTNPSDGSGTPPLGRCRRSCVGEGNTVEEQTYQEEASTDEALQCLLTARTVLYGLLARAFGAEPDSNLLALMTDEAVVEAAALLLDGEAGHPSLAEKMVEAAQEVTLDEAVGQYTRLFIGPGTLPSPPWESVHLGTDRLIFQESTLAVRDAYRRGGFKAAGYPREPDDHLGTECSFMAALAQRAGDAWAAGNKEAALSDLAIQRDFLDRHLLRWIGLFSCRLREAPAALRAGTLYPVLAEVAERFCQVDRELIDELETALGEESGIEGR